MATPQWRSGPDPNRRESGPQRLVKGSPLGSAILWVLVIAVSGAAALAVSQANWRSELPREIRDLKLLDTNTSLTLLVALLTLVAMRQQYLATLKPYITYVSRRVQPGEENRTDEGWVVAIWNVGTGVAVVQETRYRLMLSDGSESWLDYDKVVERLAALGWQPDSTYKLSRLSSGFVLGPENQISVFENAHAALKTIKMLDLELTFSSRAGERYVKDVFLIPRPPAEPVPNAKGTAVTAAAPADGQANLSNPAQNRSS